MESVHGSMDAWVRDMGQPTVSQSETWTTTGEGRAPAPGPPLFTLSCLNLFALHHNVRHLDQGPPFHPHHKSVLSAREGLVQDLNPGLFTPKARHIPLEIHQGQLLPLPLFLPRKWCCSLLGGDCIVHSSDNHWLSQALS